MVKKYLLKKSLNNLLSKNISLKKIMLKHHLKLNIKEK